MDNSCNKKIRRKTHAKAKRSDSAKIRAKFETFRREIEADIRKQFTRYKKLYLTSVIVKQLTLAISYFPTNMSIKITASKAAVKERSKKATSSICG